MMTSFINKHLLLAAMVLISLSSPALSQNREHDDLWVPMLDSPSGELVYFKPDIPRRQEPDPAWSLRTGIKKSIISSSFEQEKTAGPDAAVLKNGFFESWTRLLSEFREPAVLVEANRIAGLAKTKPYLIIPSGALHGFSRSEFIKAGLAEYALSGGVIICFAQQAGADFTALPVPAGSRIEARGWQQDAGPLFRASSVQNRHPILAGTRKTIPDIETSGYLATYPDAAKVILSRSDGFATLLLYPYGSGWVVVTTLFSDYSFDQGQLNQDEKNLVRDILFWAKAPAQLVEATPGERLKFPLAIQGAEQGEASWVKLMIMDSDGDKPLSEETVIAQVKPNQIKELDFLYTVPGALESGMYHLEYLLLNAAGEALSVRAESKSGRFSIGHPAIAAPVLRQQPLSGVATPFTIQPSLERMGSNLRLNLDILREQQTAADADQAYLVRAAGQEKSFNLGKDRQTLSFDVPEQTAGRALSFIVTHKTGRSVFRGTVTLSATPGKNVAFDKPSYLPGRKAALDVSALGSGEFSLQAPGYFEKQMISGERGASYPVPAFLPAGTYRIRWDLTAVAGEATHGELPLNIAGYRVRILDETLETSVDRGVTTVFGRFRIHATHKLETQMKLELRGPDGTTIPAVERPLTLSEGIQEVPFTLSFKPGTGGIWELRTTVETRLPDGPGYARGPVIIAAGNAPFDTSATALLGLSTDKPVYRELPAPVELSAYLFGRGKSRLELFLDNKRIRKERIDLAGPYTYTTSLSDVRPGIHVVKAVVMNEDLTTSGELSFVYGARFPDLVAELQLPETYGLSMPVSITVKNRGNLASGPSTAALYEGDPAADRTLIARADVPALEPEALHHAVIDWPLVKKAGARRLFIVADQDDAVMEANENNNTASTEAAIAGLQLSVTPGKSSFSAGESIAYSLHAANLSTTLHKNLELKAELITSAGKSLSSEVIPLTEFGPGSEKHFDRTFALAQLPQGTYKIRAQFVLSAPHPAVLSESSALTVLPTLMLQGSFEDAPPSAALCLPFPLRYTITSSGNIPPSTGTLKLDITSSDTGRPVSSRHLPFALGPATLRIDNLKLPAGKYVLTLKASAVNQNLRIARDFVLAERTLSITAPITVTRGISTLPRVLLWLGKNGSPVQQAVAVKIVQQAFEENSAYFTIVDKEEAFRNQASSGLFNTFVLFETDERIDHPGWLRDRVTRGQGLVILGSDDHTRALAEDFGFSFSETTALSGSLLVFNENTGSVLSGTMPMSGRMLVPRKNGAKAAALFSGDGKPAALLDASGNGRVLVMPFSLSRSAVDAGTSSLYSLLLRTAAESVASKADDQAGIAMQEMSVYANSDPVRARIVVTIPEGARNVWANAGGIVRNNAVTYDLTAAQEAQKLLFLYQTPSGGGKSFVEVFYECDGAFQTQGKVE